MTAQLDKRDSAIYNITDLPCIDIAMQTLARRSMFWRPVYLAQSAWLEHIPFAFWLTEAHRPRVIVELGVHYGVSYFAFCQAVERLGLDTRCFGVDTFKGDEHAGSYDERVFAQVREHNELQYSGFSRLVRSTFDDALTHFADGSVDLLHIDGLHTIDAVRHDFERWLPKLSDRAIVVMHDTNVRERNFGVFKLFEQLKQKYPHFEFVHGHGLGVLGVGKDQSELMQMLFQASNNEHGRQSVQEVFSRLGQACASAHAASTHQEKAKLLSKSIEKKKKQLDESGKSLEKAKAEIDSLDKELAEVKETIRNQLQQHAREREHFVERATIFQELRAELKDEMGRLQAHLETVSAELKLKDQELAALTRERIESQRQVDSAMAQVYACNTELVERLAERDRVLAELRQTVDKGRKETIHSGEQLRAREAELEKVNASFLQASVELEKLREENGRQVAEIVTLNQTLSMGTEAFEAQSETIAEHSKEVADLTKIVESKAIEQHVLQDQIAQLKSTNEELAQKNQALIADKNSLAADLENKLKKLGDMTKILEERNASLHAANNEAKLHQQRADKLDSDLKKKADALTTAEASLQAACNETRLHQQRADKLDSDLKKKADALTTAEARLQAANNETRLHQQRADKLDSDLKKKADALTAAEASLQAANNEMKLHQQRADKLDSDFKKKADALTATEASLQAANNEMKLHQQRADKLGSDLKKKADALTAAEKHLAEMEAQAKRLENRFIEAQSEILEAHSREVADLTKIIESKAAEQQAMQNQIAQLKSSNEEQAKRLEDRFKELAVLTKLLEERDRALIAKDDELKAEKKGMAPRTNPLITQHSLPEKVVKALTDASKDSEKEPLSVISQILLIEKSGLFDKSWYLNQYPDVAESRMNPVQHYVLHGASEGRLPGPNFDPNRYVANYPEVLSAQLNPLVHYIKNGMNEGRAAVKDLNRKSRPVVSG